MKFEIDLPIKPTEITFVTNYEGYIWFKEPDLSIDFIIGDDNEVSAKQFWITMNNLIELNQIPFLTEYLQKVIEFNKKEILDTHNNLIND